MICQRKQFSEIRENMASCLTRTSARAEGGKSSAWRATLGFRSWWTAGQVGGD